MILTRLREHFGVPPKKEEENQQGLDSISFDTTRINPREKRRDRHD